MNPGVDHYLEVGCGRCPLGGTPDCKVHAWTAELERARTILLDSGLTEEVKWKIPCYTFEKSNVVTLSALKESVVLGFFKGALLKDPAGILEKPGENTQAARQISFTRLAEIDAAESTLKAYLQEAIEVEKAGLEVELKKTSEFDVPEEFLVKLEENPELQEAFEALTPGRQRGYLLYFAGAKQSKTRTSRVEKYIPKILDGKGFHDR